MTLSEDDLRERLGAIAEWGTPAVVPPLPDSERVVVSLDGRRPRAGRGWWAAAAAVLCVALAAALLRSPAPVPIAAGTWSPMAAAPIAARSLAASVWTGTEVVVVGGQAGNGTMLRDAAAYNPTTNAWRVLPDSPVDVLPGATAMWTGREVVIVNGRDTRLTEFPDGVYETPLAGPVALDPTTGTWRRLPEPSDWLRAAAAVDGTLVALVYRDLDLFVTAYDEPGGWRDVARLDTGDLDLDDIREFDAVSAGGRVVFVSSKWIGYETKPPLVGFVVDPVTWATTPIPGPPFEGPTPQVRANVALTDAGALLMLATTQNEEHRYVHVAARYDIALSSWTSMKPLDRYPMYAEFFTGLGTAAVGEHVVVVGGINSPAIIDKRKGGSLRMAYEVAANRWHRLPMPDLDLERVGHTTVWTGRELVVWGGLHHRRGADNRADTPAPGGAVYRPEVA
ncbi:MAG TPA: kelch repeat-containing protein [Acidimicrobiales bacterium]|nr:kelch repeat-containing protein [Acidimicrobiales bacterium]